MEDQNPGPGSYQELKQSASKDILRSDAATKFYSFGTCEWWFTAPIKIN